jgi:GTP pyrophosphokinase
MSNYKIPAISDILDLSEIKSKQDKALVTKAYEFAKEAHKGQKRYSGAPYFQHVAVVASYLSEMGAPAPTVCAGLLHDVVEDTPVELPDIEEKFSPEIAMLVDGVTKLGEDKVRYKGTDRHVESLRKLFAATATDIRVLIIKLMDRLHNARTLQYVPEHKRERIAKETLEIYAPIAFRLGMSVLQKDLEDAAFRYALPSEYAKVAEILKTRKAETKKWLDKAQKDIRTELAQVGIRNFRTQRRVKGIYSLYKKLQKKDWDESKVHDILALRIIVTSVDDCYKVFGAVHKIWTPAPGRIKDYISNPKPNGYQSIHTTVKTDVGGFLEIQIRTEEMHREAQYGLAAHMNYKLGKLDKSGSVFSWIGQFIPLPTRRQYSDHRAHAVKHFGDEGVFGADKDSPHWLRLLAEAQEEIGDEYIKDLKNDFFSHRIFVFTPKGDVIDLPLGATPIDFAYAVHSEVGSHVASVKINGKMSAIDTPLENGDYVDVSTKKSSHPTRKWMEAAKTSLARRKIRTYLQEKNNN